VTRNRAPLQDALVRAFTSVRCSTPQGEPGWRLWPCSSARLFPLLSADRVLLRTAVLECRESCTQVGAFLVSHPRAHGEWRLRHMPFLLQGSYAISVDRLTLAETLHGRDGKV
jgi:hypothetical protein